MYPNREVFAHPPIVMATAQALFTDSPRLHQQETVNGIVAALSERFPISDQITGMRMQEAAPGTQPQMVPHQGLIMRNPDHTEAITLTSDSVTYETTAYRSYESFENGLMAAAQALVSMNVRPAVRRIGMRYINEVRVPEKVTDFRGWSEWIDPALTATTAIGSADVPVRAVQGAVAFDLGNNAGLTFGYAALQEGSVINAQFLARSPIPPGPSFVLDIDGYCEFKDVTLQLDTASLGEYMTAIHSHVGGAFQHAITDRARSLFRGGEA